MASQTLCKARELEMSLEQTITEEMRPSFHLSPRIGWMNDPNGFSYYNGKYHMFYQYHPYNTNWGPMHWGHAVSEDLLRWEYFPVAIAPDESYDIAGCFSGSAITLPDGRHLLMYTGVGKEQKADGTFSDIQTQCIAVGDGVEYVKYEKNPVLDVKDLPEGASKIDFRDPKIWKGNDGLFYSVVGSRPADGSGQILLFSSEDGFNWKYESTLVVNGNRFGKMWECPDFFELDGKWVLLTSPQDMLAEELEYPNGNGTLCLIGEFDEISKTFAEQHNQAIDYGVDFYAPQTVLAPDGRRIMIGWMQNWDTCTYRMPNEKWYGQMSIPREIFIQDNRLYQRPIKEVNELRSNEVLHENVVFQDTLKLDGIYGRRIDMEIEISSANEQELYKNFKINVAENEKYYTEIKFMREESILKMDRKFAGSCRAIVHEKECKVNAENGKLKMRVIMDRFSVEVFVNDGEQAMSFTIYTEQDADKISFFADGLVKMNVVKYDLV